MKLFKSVNKSKIEILKISYTPNSTLGFFCHITVQRIYQKMHVATSRLLMETVTDYLCAIAFPFSSFSITMCYSNFLCPSFEPNWIKFLGKIFNSL